MMVKLPIYWITRLQKVSFGGTSGAVGMHGESQVCGVYNFCAVAGKKFL